MTFKERYKQEMDGVKHKITLDERVLQEVERDGVSMIRRINRFVPVAVAAAIALIIMVCNFEAVAVYATALFGNFGLTLGGKEITLDEIEPLELDYERYLNDEKADKKGANYYYSYADFQEGLGIELPGNTVLDFKEIAVHLMEGSNVGHVGLQFEYENENYTMNGRFIISDYAYKGLGYGEKEKAYDVYEYAEGKNAYFVRGTDEEYQRVYFSEDEYIFQLFVENNKEGAAAAKKILDVIGKES